MQNIKFIFLVLFIIVGCKSPSRKTQTNLQVGDQGKLTREQLKEFKKTRSFQLNYDLVWNRAVNWFAENNIAIDKMEISSGQISAKYLLKADVNFLDCGFGDKKQNKKDLGFGALVVKVKLESEATTGVEVSFFGESCRSTGQIEADILNYIGRSVSFSDWLPDWYFVF